MKKIAAILYVTFTCILLGLRSYVQINLLEPDTGFYVEEALPVLIQNWALLLFCVFWAAFSFFVFDSRQEPLPHHGLSGIAQVLLGVLVLLSCVMELRSANYSELIAMVPQSVMLLLGLLSGVIFLVHGFRMMAGRSFHSTGVLISYFVPIIWIVVTLIYHFVQYTAILTISHQLFEVLFYLATAVFFLGHSGILCDISATKSLRYSMVGGGLGSLFAFLLAVPTVIAYLSGNADGLFYPMGRYLLFLSLGLYELFYLMYCLGKSHHRQRRLRDGWDEELTHIDTEQELSKLEPTDIK